MAVRLRMVAGLAAVALFVAPAASHAQGIGIKAGYSYGSVPNNSGVLPGELSAHSGVAIGLGLLSGGVIGWGADALYAERGFSSSSAGSSQQFTYVDVPVYLRAALSNPVITPFAFAGPQASIELRCDGGGGDCPSGRPKTTYAGVIGGGATLHRLAGLSVEGRYVYGLTNLNLSTVSNSENYKTRSFMILVGLGF